MTEKKNRPRATLTGAGGQRIKTNSELPIEVGKGTTVYFSLPVSAAGHPHE